MISLFHKYWWTFLLRGVTLSGMAVILLLYLNASQLPKAYIFSLYLFLEGIFTLIPLFEKTKLREFWTFIIRASSNFALALSYSIWPKLIAFVMPDVAVSMRLIFVAIWGAVTGLLGIFEFYQFKNENVERRSLLLSSLLAMALGLVLYFQLDSEIMTLLWIIFGFMVSIGVSLIIFGIQCHKQRQVMS